MSDTQLTREAEGIDLFNLIAARRATPEGVRGFEELEQELAAFEAAERERLGLVEEPVAHWHDPVPDRFTRDQRETTTVLLGGLTMAQDTLVTAALAGLGYKVEALPVPDYESLRFGKEFGNRGQCNPTYFTVGNLIKHLTALRDGGQSTERIVSDYLFLTAGACGPCRFGTYVTEYRKALVDAGFEGFRVLLFQQSGGLKQATGDAPGLDFSPPFFVALVKAVMAGDVLNAVGYRMRPYEVVPGQTDAALADCREILCRALERKKSVVMALRRCKRRLARVTVDRLQPKPKVMIIGEFWAMTTEGDGNYRLQRFLESEGAEVDIQLVTAWLLYCIWEVQYDTRLRMTLPEPDADGAGLADSDPRKTLAMLWAAEKTVRSIFAIFARAIGLGRYHLPDMDEIAAISHQHYDCGARGGEGHMEVGKLIQSVTQRKAHMVISVKPFGCMPSSGVSDGVQSLITTRYPEAIFTAIETTGDGEVNVHSRIQMDLFKARQVAEQEYAELLEGSSQTAEQLVALAGRRGKQKALYYPKHSVAGTGANVLVELGA